MICDSHVHVVANPARHPQAADRTYTAGEAPLATLERLGAPHNVGHFVLVQPSFYGTDNTVMLDALAVLGDRGRGVAVIDPATVDQPTLADLATRGVRGLRINLYSTLGGRRDGALEQSFEAVTAVAQVLGMHVEVIAPATIIAGTAAMLAQSPVPVVIEHYGLHQGTPRDAVGTALLRLMELTHVWTKLSAPYRAGGDPLAVRPDADWLRAILGVCGERCVWGSDWPHTPPHGLERGVGVPLPYRALSYDAVLEGMRQSLPSDSLADLILRQNPARLYQFG